MTKHAYSDALLLAFPDHWNAAINHPFVSALCAGNLPHEAFKEYVIQDWIFCQAVQKLIAYTIAKMPEKTVKSPHQASWESLKEKLARRVRPGAEMRALEQFIGQLDIQPEELHQASLVTRGFSDYLIALGATATYKECLIALLVITYVYEAWAEKFTGLQSGDRMIDRWIKVHQDRALGPTVAILRDLIDASRPESPPHINHKHEQVLQQCLAWEVTFWESISNYGMYQWPVGGTPCETRQMTHSKVQRGAREMGR